MHESIKCANQYLENLSSYNKLNEEVELWLRQKIEVTDLLIKNKNESKEIKQLDLIQNKINHNINEINHYSATKVKYLTELSIKIYGNFNIG